MGDTQCQSPRAKPSRAWPWQGQQRTGLAWLPLNPTLLVAFGTAGTRVALCFGSRSPRSWLVVNLHPGSGAAPGEGVCSELVLAAFFPK